MVEHIFPLRVSIYKGEGRILIIPIIDHIGGYSINADWFRNIKNVDDITEIGESIISAIKYIEETPISKETPKDRDFENSWKMNSKYKSYISFWKNNFFARLKFYSDGKYEVHSLKRSEKKKGLYTDIVEERILSANITAEVLGKAVIEVFEAIEEHYNSNEEPTKQTLTLIELLDESKLSLPIPEDKHFEDYDDCHTAEIYKCYSYIPQENAESSADFFLGIAPELDCETDYESIKSAWEETYGEAEYFDLKEVDYGIFKIRVEMKNKEIHKISYILQQEEDLLLECGMAVYQPNRRKKLYERLITMFEEFAIGCKFEN